LKWKWGQVGLSICSQLSLVGKGPFLTGEAWFNKHGCVYGVRPSGEITKKSTKPLPDIIRLIELNLQVADILRLLLRLCHQFLSKAKGKKTYLFKEGSGKGREKGNS
jgi:hypothetical protein